MIRKRATVLILAMGVIGGGASASAQSPSLSADASPVPIRTPATLPPDGSWQVELSTEELSAAGASEQGARAGVFTWTFGEGRATISVSYADGGSVACAAVMQSMGDLVRLSYTGGACGDEVDSIRWALGDEGLRLTLVETSAPFADNKAYLEAKPWQAVSAKPTIGVAADDGARIVAVDTIDSRTRDLTIESPSVGHVKVRLLLPADFEAEPSSTWPVLYLLHGAWGNHEDWTNLTDVNALTASTDLLVVMPDAATAWYADAWNDGAGGPPAWETFHTTELLQLIERNWHAADRRVVAGLSMGGFGAMEYAARHPGMFLAAASYSGVMDTTGSQIDNGVATFGDPVAQSGNWKAHNPLDLASKLRGIPLYVSYGDGQPGPLDPPGTTPSDLEEWIAPQNDRFVARLVELDIPVTVDAYGPGTHEWPYWQRALHRSLPMLLAALGEHPGASPSPVVSESAP